jgi:hypothetical protein
MTTTTTARKVPAKKVADKATTPVAKAPAKAAATTPKPAAEKRQYQAQGRGGKVNTRSFTQVMTHAVDVADKDARSEQAKLGLIWSFFATEEAAKTWAAKKVAAGYDAIVVEAKPVTK